jgi:NAD(P)-dependent dehydrogenase (short-subunit alcohol dehydrogenase family)
VNNAASRPGRDRALVVDLDEEAWDHVFRVNVRGTFLCSRAAARAMIHQGRGGKIVMLSSTKGKQGAVKHAAYAASKFAILGFAQSLALELAPHRINVNSICPGVVNTAATAFVVFLFTRLYHWWWDSLPRFLFFAAIGLLGIGLVLAFKRLRQHMALNGALE